METESWTTSPVATVCLAGPGNPGNPEYLSSSKWLPVMTLPSCCKVASIHCWDRKLFQPVGLEPVTKRSPPQTTVHRSTTSAMPGIPPTAFLQVDRIDVLYRIPHENTADFAQEAPSQLQQ
ncbi:hypothetical protein Tcan_18676 [Toxocara canis]|uniref:Uncharacterized protein n=1 Tax=Toxocara canis TaxID=6265 RepID=A0A0B2V6S4_TOXCA|nr:hypothetical protein Tcan_18676 [Toxocara canis]